MSSDPNKKSPRTFQCRDMLWETFEQMARELECSVDYLINEAMKQYARTRVQGSQRPYPNAGGASARPESIQESRQEPRQGAYPSAAPQSQAMAAPPQAMRTGSPGRNPASTSLPPPARTGPLPVPPPPPARAPGMQTGMGMQAQPRSGGGLSSNRPQQPATTPRSAPPPIPGGMPSARGGGSMPPMQSGGYNGAVSGQGATLSIMYQGEKVGVSKDRFVIGRGKQSSDLTLKDPNVSRQHAMIEYQNGVYFMVDMGSTNGVEYNGQRIAREQIAEGDVFRICDHDLRFTYR